MVDYSLKPCLVNGGMIISKWVANLRYLPLFSTFSQSVKEVRLRLCCSANQTPLARFFLFHDPYCHNSIKHILLDKVPSSMTLCSDGGFIVNAIFLEEVLSLEFLDLSLSFTFLPTGSEERRIRRVWKYSCCNTSLLSRYESYWITIA